MTVIAPPRRQVPPTDPESDIFSAGRWMPNSDLGCGLLTPAQAQSVVDALVHAGWGVEDSGPPPPGSRIVLAEMERNDPFDMSTTVAGTGRLGLWFESVLPHGVPECACYG